MKSKFEVCNCAVFRDMLYSLEHALHLHTC